MGVPVPPLLPVTVPVVTNEVQLYVVPATEFGVFVRLMLVVDPLQIVCDAGAAVTLGVGLTVISTVMGLPGQPLAQGVIVYWTTPAVLRLLANVCEMGVPVPLLLPVTVPVVTNEVQL